MRNYIARVNTLIDRKEFELKFFVRIEKYNFILIKTLEIYSWQLLKKELKFQNKLI